MSGSITETKPVFDTILRNLLRLFGTSYAVVQLLKDGMIHLVAFDGEPGFEQLASYYPIPLDDSTITGHAMLSKQVLQVAPLIGNPATPSASARFAREHAYNSLLSAPMIREGEVIGAIATARRDPGAFDDKQVALIKSFANQAVIAIENTRLLNELRQRTADLTESLEQQTATSDVLSVISSSPGNLNPVFEAILANAVRICKTHFGVLLLFEGGRMRVVAMKNAPQAFAEMRRRDPYIPLEKSILGPVVRTKTLAHVSDITAAEPYASSPLAKVGGARTALGVPMLKEGELVGAIAFLSPRSKSIFQKQIGLLQNLILRADGNCLDGKKSRARSGECQ
jgi:two-component system, NtrC family, sensor kinase